MDTKWSPTTKYIFAVGLVLIAALVIYISRPILGIAMAALIIAFLTYPIVRFLNEHLKFPMGLAVLGAYLFVGLVLSIIPIIVTPIAIDAVGAINLDAFVDWIQAQVEGFKAWLVSIRTIQIFSLQFSLTSLVDPILSALEGTTPSELASLEKLLELVPRAFGSVTSVAGFLATTISSVALQIFLTLIIAVYLSLDARRFYDTLIDLTPEAFRPELRTLLIKITGVWSAFFRGQITVSLILALITWLGATAIGLPGAFVLGLSAGVLALIPSLGPFLALIPAVIVALVQGSTYLPVSNLTFTLIVLGLYLLIQQLEGNLITPRIVGQAIDLPPVVVLVGVVIGTFTAGLLGAVLAAPIIATGRVLVTYTWNKILDRDPFRGLEEKSIEPPSGRPLSAQVRSAYEQLQEQYKILVANAQPWPDDDEEE